MAGRLTRRIVGAILTLLLVTAVVFSLIHLAPGSPLGEEPEASGSYRLSAAALAEIRRQYRLDQPLHRQYGAWLRDLARADLGRSFHDRRPVVDKVTERLPVTLTLNAISLAFVLALAVPLGALAALRPGSAFDRLGAIGTHVLYAVPAFWAGLLLQMLFAVRLDWLPLAGLRSPESEWMGGLDRRLDEAAHLVLPAICLGYAGLAYVSRFVRATLLDNAAIEVARGARARGLSELAVLWRHGLRQTAIPLLTLAGFLIPGLLGGSVVVETVFAIPGLGRLFADAAFQRDLPVVMALTLVSGIATVLGILIADLAYAVADPRVRRG